MNRQMEVSKSYIEQQLLKSKPKIIPRIKWHYLKEEASADMIESLSCIICQNIPLDPVECDKCQKVLCEECMINLQSTSNSTISNLYNECPDYHKKCKIKQINRNLRQLVFDKMLFTNECCKKITALKQEQQKKKDENKTNGRRTRAQKQKDKILEKEEFTYSEMTKHIQSECPQHHVYQCPNTCSKDKEFNLVNLRSHLEIDCPLTEIVCTVCQYKIEGLRHEFQINKHSDEKCVQNLKMTYQLNDRRIKDLKEDIKALNPQSSQQQQGFNAESIFTRYLNRTESYIDMAQLDEIQRRAQRYLQARRSRIRAGRYGQSSNSPQRSNWYYRDQ